MFSYFAKLRRFTWSLRIRYSLHANFRANKFQANFLAPKCQKLDYFTAVSVRHVTKYATLQLRLPCSKEVRIQSRYKYFGKGMLPN